MIRVAIVDDHAVVRAGLIRLLATFDGIEVAGEAGDGEAALALVEREHPDIALLDISMPGMDGIATARLLRERVPATRLVMLSSFARRSQVLAALDAGAIGYLLKDAEPAEVEAAIRAAARGDSPLAPRVANALLVERAERRPMLELSAREREVLELVAHGLPNKTIARRLEISEKTVKAHLTSVYRTIGVDDRVQAALWARDRGLDG